MNKVFLVGRLTRDPDLRYGASNNAVMRTSIAVDRQFTNQNGEREADFINIVAFGNRAETMKKYLTKGSQIAVSEYDLKPLYLPHDYNNEHPTGYFKYYVYGRKGVVDSRGRVVIPAIYEEINQLDTFLFEAKFNSYEGPWRLIEVTK